MRSFWHTMTSYDRHASHNSPYRTGSHVALPQSRHAPLTSVATNASDSRTDLNASYSDGSSSPGKKNSALPYSPGMRTSMQRVQSSDDTTTATNKGAGEIQMQAFQEGLPPPPPVGHSWRRIDRWTEDSYEELLDNLGEGCTQNDINELEHELDCTLPMEVRESLQVHDGQERGGRPTGILFGAMLLDCEEIVEEWRHWRRVDSEFLSSAPTSNIPESPTFPSKAFDGASTSAPIAQQQPQSSANNNSHWKEALLARQDSQPPNALQKAYAHPAWIPLARDWGGNNLAVDLAPGPAGKWGQIILTGRDYDCKFVVARSWAALLATVADDLSTSKVFVHEETGELKLREFQKQNVEPAYLDILRWRADQKYGRLPPPKRRSGPGPPQKPRVDTRNQSGSNQSAAAVARLSPYSSPVATSHNERSSSPQRFPAKGIASGSPRSSVNVSSPLARVAEEAPAPLVRPRTESPLRKGSTAETGRRGPELRVQQPPLGRLISTDSPTGNVDASSALAAAQSERINGSIGGSGLGLGVQTVGEEEKGKENVRAVIEQGAAGLGMSNIDLSTANAEAKDGKKSAEVDGGMRNVEI